MLAKAKILLRVVYFICNYVIVVSTQCVFSLRIVLHSKWRDQSPIIQISKAITSKDRESLSKVEHKHDNSVKKSTCSQVYLLYVLQRG